MNELKRWEPKEREVQVKPITPLPIPSAELLDNPEELFLFLTAWTCPYRSEEVYYGEMLQGLGFKRDGLGNWWKQVGGNTSATCFMAHLDTADDEPEPITRIIEDGYCKTDGQTILGADDRAGVTILLYLQNRNVPGLYYLFVGEEAGCIGSKKAAAEGYVPEGYQRCISFDRRGKTSIITRQCGTRTCSDEFAWQLSNALNAYGFQYSPDSNGLFTDSIQFAKVVPECTNISVGYLAPHSVKEEQDLVHLAYLAEVCAELDWEALATKRDPAEVDKTYGYQGGGYRGSDNWRSGSGYRSGGYSSGWSADDWDDRGYDYYGSASDWWDRKERGELQRYGYSTDRYSEANLGALDKALEAMDRIAEAFVGHRDIDTGDIAELVMTSPIDTIENIELLLDSLHTKIRWITTDDDTKED